MRTRWEGSTVPKMPLSEAAHVLGVSTSALRRRLRAGTLAGEKETAPPYRWLVEVSGDAQARPGALTAAASDRTAAVEAENAGLRRELATLGEALRFARDQAERSAITLEQLTRALPAPAADAAPARAPWWRRAFVRTFGR